MAGGRGGRGNGRGGRGGRGGNNGRRVVQVVSPQPGAKNKTGGAKTLDARFTAMNKRRAEQVQRGTTARYAATMAKRTGQSAKKFAAPVAVAGKGKKTVVAKKGVAVGKKKVTVAAKKAKLAAKKDARKAKAKGTAAPAKKATQAKKAPKKKKTKPAKPEYKPEDLDEDLDSYMAAAPANPEAMAA